MGRSEGLEVFQGLLTLGFISVEIRTPDPTQICVPFKPLSYRPCTALIFCELYIKVVKDQVRFKGRGGLQKWTYGGRCVGNRTQCFPHIDRAPQIY